MKKEIHLPDYYDPRIVLKHYSHLAQPAKKIPLVERFLHYLLTRDSHYKWSKRNGFKYDGYVQVSKKKRKTLMSDDYAKISVDLDGVLWDSKKVNGKPFYLMGSACMQFQLKTYNSINRRKLQPSEWSTVQQLKKVRFNHFEEDQTTFKHIAQETDKFKLKTDISSVRQIVHILRSTYPIFKTESPFDAIRNFNGNNTVESFIDKFGQRLHTSITTLKSELRQFIYHVDHPDTPLVAFDIKSSQPFLMTNLSNSFIGQYVSECTGAIPLLNLYRHNTDSQLFSQQCQNGVIYEYFMYLMNQYYGYNLTRDQIKKYFMYILFSDYDKADINTQKHFTYKKVNTNHLLKKGGKRISKKKKRKRKHSKMVFKAQMYHVFVTQFPSLHKCIKAIRRLDWSFNSSKSHKKHYTNNCLLLQRAESRLFYNCIVPTLIEHGYSNLSTIHDSVILPLDDPLKNSLVVKQIIEDTITQAGLPVPKIDIKIYD